MQRSEKLVNFEDVLKSFSLQAYGLKDQTTYDTVNRV